jgi:hypothetical protein
MSDIVERLRKHPTGGINGVISLMDEAAAEITRLRAELEARSSAVEKLEGLRIDDITALGMMETRANHLGAQVEQLKTKVASCEGEQEHFETWAKSQQYEMREHPLHYLFLDAKTNAARQGWKAALRYVTTALPSTEGQP